MSAFFRRGARRASAEEAAAVEVVEVEGGSGPGDDEAVEEVEELVFDRSNGPWDVSELDSTEGRLDLGALRVLGREGMELRLEVENESGRVTSVTVALDGSLVQVQVFAAPRREGIWGEIREEIAEGIRAQGGTAEETQGVFGTELVARIPVRTSDGRPGKQPARFVGVDGPRWFLRAVFNGRAVADPQAATVLEALVRDMVVVRGPEAMAPRELIALRLPREAGAARAAAPAQPVRPALDPFTRGPEITEIR